MRTPISGAPRLAIAQAGVLLAFVVLLISPIEIPDLLGLGPEWSWTTTCLIVSALIWIPDLVAGRFPSTALDGILGAYLVLVGVTAIWSVDLYQTWAASLALIGEVSLFYATVTVVRKLPGLTGRVLLLLVAGIALVELMAFAHHLEVGLATRPKSYPVPQGWSGYPELGALAVVQFGVLMAGLQAARSFKQALAVAGVLLVSAVEVLFLYSRTTWLAAAVIVLAAVVISGRKVLRVLMVSGALLILVAAVAITSPTVRSLGRNLAGKPALASAPALELAAPAARMKLWEETFRMIADSPLHGVGLGNFRSVFEARYNPELNGDLRRGVHAHSLWLQVTAELGVVGGLAYASLWVGLLWVSWRAARHHPSFVTAGLLLAIVGMAVSNATDNVPSLIGGARLYSLTWVIFGLAAATATVPRQLVPHS